MAGFEREQGSLAVQTCTDAFCFYFVHVERHLDACQFIKLNSIKIIQEGSLLGPTNFAPNPFPYQSTSFTWLKLLGWQNYVVLFIAVWFFSISILKVRFSGTLTQKQL
jgi:hypothetical protein